MNKLGLFFISFIFILNSSCKKCRVCECTKNGASEEKKNCSYGATNDNTLDAWEENLRQNGGYDKVECHNE